jgi:uncharacterized membrane protein YeaQ/YmgE (transglycosylase-associated protein family)
MDAGMLVSPVWVMLVLTGAMLAFISIVIFGPSACRIVVLIGAGCLGAMVGQMSSDMLGWRWIQMGDLHLLQTAIGSILLLMVARSLASRRAIKKKGAQ